jgi:hypothetical protein
VRVISNLGFFVLMFAVILSTVSLGLWAERQPSPFWHDFAWALGAPR